MNNKNNRKTSSGIFLLLLALTFITLKLTGHVEWSWLWVLSPVWIPIAVALVIVLIVLVSILKKMISTQVQLEQKAAAYAADIDAEAAKHGLERQPGESNLDLKKRIAYAKQAERRSKHNV